MLTFGLLGASIGLLAGLSPGPVLTLVVAETLKGGWLRGAAVAAGPLLADAPIILAAVLLMNHLPPAFEPLISITGGLFLLYLAVSAAFNARRAIPPQAVENRAAARGGLLTGLLARALSPNPYLFWFLVGAPTLVQAHQTAPGAEVVFLAGYYVTIVGSNVGLAVAIHHWMRLVSERVYRLLLFVASLVLAVYAVLLLGRGLQSAQSAPPAR